MGADGCEVTTWPRVGAVYTVPPDRVDRIADEIEGNRRLRTP
jgi:hypothetical protein